MRIRCVAMEVARSLVDGPDADLGFIVPVPDDHLSWTPFQIEMEPVTRQPSFGEWPMPERRDDVRLTIWLRLDEE